MEVAKLLCQAYDFKLHSKKSFSRVSSVRGVQWSTEHLQVVTGMSDSYAMPASDSFLWCPASLASDHFDSV